MYQSVRQEQAPCETRAQGMVAEQQSQQARAGTTKKKQGETILVQSCRYCAPCRPSWPRMKLTVQGLQNDIRMHIVAVEELGDRPQPLRGNRAKAVLTMPPSHGEAVWPSGAWYFFSTSSRF